MKPDLNLAWRILNEVCFDDELSSAKIHAFRSTIYGWKEAEVLIGAYHPDSSEILVHIGGYVNMHEGGILEALYHEMVHQYIEEVLMDRDSAPHGKLFKDIYNNGLERLCRYTKRRAVENSGVPTERSTKDPEQQPKQLHKVAQRMRTVTRVRR